MGNENTKKLSNIVILQRLSIFHMINLFFPISIHMFQYDLNAEIQQKHKFRKHCRRIIQCDERKKTIDDKANHDKENDDNLYSLIKEQKQ